MIVPVFFVYGEDELLADVPPGDVDEVLLVGEQCRMPMFQQRAQEFFVQVPVYLDEPGPSVVLGAARLSTSSSTPPPSSSGAPPAARR
jgi:molecular chaperone DnaK (HSP70)